jgi:hypothetical protein
VRAILAVPLAATLALAAAPPAGPPKTTTAQVPANGLAWTLPPGWFDVSQPLTGVVEPPQQLAAATFALHQSKPDRGCSPDMARRQLPPDGVLVQLVEHRDSAGVRARLRKLPPRPRHFRLHRRAIRPLECFGPALNVPFRTRERAFQAFVMVGARVTRPHLAQAERLLDSLVVQRIPPPPPPARWPIVSTEAGDGLSVPFGWRAASLDGPRRLPRPRLLFWTSNHALPQHPSGRRPWLGDPALRERARTTACGAPGSPGAATASRPKCSPARRRARRTSPAPTPPQAASASPPSAASATPRQCEGAPTCALQRPTASSPASPTAHHRGWSSRCRPGWG